VATDIGQKFDSFVDLATGRGPPVRVIRRKRKRKLKNHVAF